MSTNIEIIATFKGEFNRFENIGGDVVVANFVAEGESSVETLGKAGFEDSHFQGKGKIGDEDNEQFTYNRTYRLFGRWKSYFNRRQNQDIKQFCFTDFVEHTPHSKEGLIDYLASHGKGKRIGPAMARMLVDKIGVEDVLNTCRTDIERVVEVTSVERQNAEAFAASLNEQAAVENTILELNNILGKRGFPKSLSKKLVSKFKNSAPSVIQGDPYVLMQFRNVGFKLADKLWLDLGKDPRDIRRQTMCLWYIINSDRDGHVWHLSARIIKELSRMIGGEIDPRGAILHGKEIAATNESPHGVIATIKTNGVNGPILADGDTLWLADATLANQERSIAVALAKSVGEMELATMTKFTPEEKTKVEYIEHATCHRCRRHLKADAVHVLDGKPYGPTCITKVYGGEEAETVPLAVWIDRNPIVSTWIKENPTGIVRVKEASVWPEPSTMEGISDHQRDGLAAATKDRIGLLTGSPGTGKTTCVASLVRAALNTGLIGLHEIALAAPTGKASVRMTQSLQEKGLRLPCRTWHSLLGTSVDESDGSSDWSFQHTARNPWPFRMVIGDEQSMPDTPITHSIFDARAPGCHFLLVGDINQLAPVGPGAPFRDMIAAGISMGELTEIHRNDGGIVQACTDIRDENPWAHRYVNNWDSNLTITNDRTDGDKINRLFEMVVKANDDGFDPYWDTQVITAVNEKSKLSRVALNKKLQEEFNNSPIIKGTRFRENDKVVCLKNGSYLQLESRNEVYVANGEIGRVIEIDAKKRMMQVELRFPDRQITVFFGTDKKTARGDDKPGTSNWDLGYAISCHKFQGSEAGRIITILDGYGGAQRVCDRSWMTTAISRAVDHQCLIGTAQLAEKFCRKLRINERKTFLRERIILANMNREAVSSL